MNGAASVAGYLVARRWMPELPAQLRQRLRRNRDQATHDLFLIFPIFFLLFGCMAFGFFLMVTA